VDAADLHQRLADLVREHHVPGASLAVRLGDERVTATAGMANPEAGWPVTDRTLFQVGSITKLFTSTLAMQLVEEGRLELDAPVGPLLREFAEAVDERLPRVTLRQLLAHTSGIESDYFADHGRGDDCRELCLRGMARLPLLHEPGEMFSYSNSGIVVVARLVERALGTTWEAALHERLFEALGMSDTAVLPEEVLLHPAATGQLTEDQGFRPAFIWYRLRCMGASGVVSSTPSDLLRFADAFMAADGRLLDLPGARVEAMWQPESVPPSPEVDAYGLGWAIFQRRGPRIVGHFGDTPGHSAAFVMVPEATFALAVSTNIAEDQGFRVAVLNEVMTEALGVKLPWLAMGDPHTVAAADAERFAARVAGRYERLNFKAEVRAEGGEISMRLTRSEEADRNWRGGPVGGWAMTVRCRPVDPETFVESKPEGPFAEPLFFLGTDADGWPRYLHDGHRAFRRVSHDPPHTPG
jgi:CubicO group peptidase (beta-lactamase class C family)